MSATIQTIPAHEREGFRQWHGHNWDDDDCPFQLEWQEWLPANEINPAEHIVVGVETGKGLVEVYRKEWFDMYRKRHFPDPKPPIIEKVLKEMNAGHEFSWDAEVENYEPNFLIYAVEEDLLPEFEQKFAVARRDR